MGLATRLALLSFLGAARAESLVVGMTKMATSENATFDQSNSWELIKIGVAEKLFTLDENGEVVPQIAESISGDGKAWEVTIKKDYKYSDGSVVTAADVATCLTAMQASLAASSSVSGMTFVADGDTKVKITSEDSTHIMSTILAEWSFPIFKVSGTDSLYTGPYKIKHLEPGDHMDLEPNTHYADADKRPTIEVKQYADAAALGTAAKNKEVDLAFTLAVDDLAAIDAVDGMSTMSYGVEYHYMLIYNMASGRATSDLKVRQAIDHAVDRTALSQSIKGGHGTRSYFPKGTWYSDPVDKQTADAAAAGTKLDEAGWALADDKRSKDGADLKLTVVAYPFRPDLITMLPEVKTQLEAVSGVAVEAVATNGSWANGMPCGFPPSTPTEYVCFADGSWDVLMWAQNTLPSGDPVSFLTMLTEGGISEKAAYTPGSDTTTKVTAVDSATTHKARSDATTAAQAAIFAELPVSNLLTPEWHIGISDKMKNMGYHPYGADYYVIRADAPIIGAGAYVAADSSAMSMSVALALCAALLF